MGTPYQQSAEQPTPGSIDSAIAATEALNREQELADALGAFAWIVSKFELGDYVRGVKVDDVPRLVAAVEAAIVTTVKTYNVAAYEKAVQLQQIAQK